MKEKEQDKQNCSKANRIAILFKGNHYEKFIKPQDIEDDITSIKQRCLKKIRTIKYLRI